MKSINNPPIQRRNKTSDPNVLATQLADIATLVPLNISINKDGTYLLQNNATYDLGGKRIVFANDVTFLGNGATLTNGIIDCNGKSVRFKDVTFNNAWIDIQWNITDLVVRNCKFINCADNAIALWGSANLVQIIDNIFNNITVSTGTNKNFNNSGGAIYINTTNTITKCEIRDNDMTYIYGGQAMNVCANFTFFDIFKNRIDTIGQRGINFWNANSNSSGRVRHNTILNCGVLKASGANAGVGCNGIYANLSMPYVDVYKNVIKNVYENGIEGNYRSIEGNYVENTGTDQTNYPTPSIEGIYTQSTPVIKGNTVINPAGHGIYGYQETDFTNLTLIDNVIKKTSLDSGHSGICFRSTNCTNVTDIRISNNVIENFGTIIELPQNKKYDVKLGVNFSKGNYTKYFEFGGAGAGVDIGRNGSLIPLFTDNMFKTWTDTATLTNWSKANATLSQTTVDNHYVPHVLASDAFNGRIYQNIYTPVSDNGNRFLQLTLTMRGISTPFVRSWHLDITGANPTGATSYNVPMLSSTVFKKYHLIIPCNGYMKIEICNTNSGDWYEIAEIQSFLVDWKAES